MGMATMSVGVRVSRMTAICTAAILPLAAGLRSVSDARERGPRVEVLCPVPPLSVRVGRQPVLAYELHVTNFDTVPLQLTRVDLRA